MNNIEKHEQELAELYKKVNELEELIYAERTLEDTKGNYLEEYPEEGETFYYVGFSPIFSKLVVTSKEWKDNDPAYMYIWEYCNGTKDENKAKWEKQHLKLLNKIKKHTRPFKTGVSNWYFILDKDFALGTEEYHYTELNTEYGFFPNEETIQNFIQAIGEETIVKYLFPPRNGDYSSLV